LDSSLPAVLARRTVGSSTPERRLVHTVGAGSVSHVDWHHALGVDCLMLSAINVWRDASAAMQLDPGEVVAES